MPDSSNNLSSFLIKSLSSLLKDLDFVAIGLISSGKLLNNDGDVTFAKLVYLSVIAVLIVNISFFVYRLLALNIYINKLCFHVILSQW